MNPKRRQFIQMAPGASRGVLAAGCAAHPMTRSSGPGPGNLYRIDDAAKILAVAREIIAADGSAR